MIIKNIDNGAEVCNNLSVKTTATKKVLAVSAMGFSTAFASMSAQDAENIVLKEYPGATIHRVDRDYDDGRRVYEVDFRTDSIWDGELTIDADTGKILERKEKY